MMKDMILEALNERAPDGVLFEVVSPEPGLLTVAWYVDADDVVDEQLAEKIDGHDGIVSRVALLFGLWFTGHAGGEEATMRRGITYTGGCWSQWRYRTVTQARAWLDDTDPNNPAWAYSITAVGVYGIETEDTGELCGPEADGAEVLLRMRELVGECAEFNIDIEEVRHD